MTIYGLLIVALGLVAALAIAREEQKNEGWGFTVLLLYAVHVGFSAAYWYILGQDLVDANSYFYDVGRHGVFGLGTDFIFWLVGSFRRWIPDASYLDCYMLFGFAGFLGSAYLLRTMREVSGDQYKRTRLLVYGLLLIPGLNFWTAAIGKDALMYLGIQMVAYGMLKPTKRPITLGVGFLLSVMIRPHIAVLLGAACGIGLLMGSKLKLEGRILSVTLLLITVGVVTPIAMQRLGITSLEGGALSEYIAVSQASLAIGDSAVDMERYGYLAKLFTYLFRPLPWEGTSAITLLSGLENTAYLAIFAATLAMIAQRFDVAVRTPFLILCAAFLLFGASASALVTSNLGMAVRQKTQFLPFLLIVMVALYGKILRDRAYRLQERRLRRQAAQEAVQPAERA